MPQKKVVTIMSKRKPNIKIVSIVGARPNMMKVSPLINEMRKYKDINSLLIHTGQHYDRNMSKVFFKDLAIPKPDVYLGIGSGTHAEQTARIMVKLEKVFLRIKPDLVIVVGDVNSTMAASITASKLNIPLAHVEAGLRSFDRTMPEEINRVLTDSVSNYLFSPSEDAVKNLKNEGHANDEIFFVGNIMIDTLLKQKKKAASSPILKNLGLSKNKYITLTLHRPCNVDRKAELMKIFAALNRIQKDIKIVFPIHLRTRKMIQKFNLANYLKKMKGIIVVPPLGYLDFLKLLCNSRLVLTDSGGIQEETTALGVSCVTLRDVTERPSTIAIGTNVLTGSNTQKIIATTRNILKGRCKLAGIPKLWDGKTSERIIKIIRERLAKA